MTIEYIGQLVFQSFITIQVTVLSGIGPLKPGGAGIPVYHDIVNKLNYYYHAWIDMHVGATYDNIIIIIVVLKLYYSLKPN